MSTFAINLPSSYTDNQAIYRLVGKLLSGSGVLDSAALTVAAQGTPDMTVKVSGSASSNNAVFITSSGVCYLGWNTASVNVTIASNSSGSTKTDTVVAYVDLAAGVNDAGNPNSPGALKFLAVRGASGAPTDTEIQASSVGSNPFIRLANITVANGVGSINSGNISDQRTSATVSQKLSSGLVTLANIASEASTSFTPTWTTGGTAPTLGNGSLTGNYMKIGRTVIGEMFLTFGSTTSAGTGAWFFNFPVTPASRYATGGVPVGACSAQNFGVDDYFGQVNNFDSTKMIPRLPNTSTPGKMAGLSNTLPFTWGSADTLALSFRYEAAS